MQKKELELLSIKQASLWASEYLKKEVTSSNISYLIQYGMIQKHKNDGNTAVDKADLIDYYKTHKQQREILWKEKLGNDLNWTLSFDHLKEKETTKHIHRLHPYKGKFIPQLVEYFLDEHRDNFKKEVYFQKNDIVLDPFAGSGTTLIQANELGIHAIGIDISTFNTLITNVKLAKTDLNFLQKDIEEITLQLQGFISKHNNIAFEKELSEQLTVFNKKFFPSPEYKRQVRKKQINEEQYSLSKERDFLQTFQQLQDKYQIKLHPKTSQRFLEKWYLEPVRKEIEFTQALVNKVEDSTTKMILTVLLSRTIRSCRATTHADLATLKEPISQPYYCQKHGKICKPLFSILYWWKRYSKDTIQRFSEFQKLRTNTFQVCLQGDARNLDVFSYLQKANTQFANLAKSQKIKGIFSSPPYVGLINYHEQHAYAYDLFDFCRNDLSEIGSLALGQGQEARKLYVDGVANVLSNSKKYLQEDYDVFLVANDKYNLYPSISQKANMQIVNYYKRPVLNRTEKDKSAYSEIIFHLKEK